MSINKNPFYLFKIVCMELHIRKMFSKALNTLCTILPKLLITILHLFFLASALILLLQCTSSCGLVCPLISNNSKTCIQWCWEFRSPKWIKFWTDKNNVFLNIIQQNPAVSSTRCFIFTNPRLSALKLLLYTVWELTNNTHQINGRKFKYCINFRIIIFKLCLNYLNHYYLTQ